MWIMLVKLPKISVDILSVVWYYGIMPTSSEWSGYVTKSEATTAIGDTRVEHR